VCVCVCLCLHACVHALITIVGLYQDEKGGISTPLSSCQVSRESSGCHSGTDVSVSEAAAVVATSGSPVNIVDAGPRPVPPGMHFICVGLIFVQKSLEVRQIYIVV